MNRKSCQRGKILRVAAMLTSGLGLASTLAKAEPKTDACVIVADGEPVTVRGQIVQSATTAEGEGEPPHKYMMLILDKPVCFKANPFGEHRDNEYSVVVTPVATRWLGHEVVVTGEWTEGDGSWIVVHRIMDVE
jgi:hypothetical protein